MANLKFTQTNGTTIEVLSTGQVWSGFVTVAAADVEVGDGIGSGCGLHTFEVTAIELVEEEA